MGAEAVLGVLAQAAVFAHTVELANADMPIGSGSSFIKLVGTDTIQEIGDLLLEAVGSHGGDLDTIDTPDGPLDAGGFFRQARRNSIFAGTSEIQRGVTAKRVLGLP